MEDRKTVDIHVNFLECLTLLLIALRLTGAIAWSWLWVLAPLWLPFTILIIVAIFAAIAG